MATTTLLCAFSITPYIYFNLGAKEKYDMGFPSFPCYWKLLHSALIQLLIQRRITTNTLSSETSCLIQMSTRRWPLSLATPPTRRNIKWMQAHGCCCSSSLSVASVVGYVGCFSVVQNSIMNIGPVSWLCLDAGFSVLRLAIWTWNPTRDNFANMNPFPPATTKTTRKSYGTRYSLSPEREVS
jgi:hypothetical protein